jgi:hypothetical protein
VEQSESDQKGVAKWKIALAIIWLLAIIAAIVGCFYDSWWRDRLISDMWPLDTSHISPNLLATVIQYALIFITVALFYPPFRKWLATEFHKASEERKRHHQEHLETLTAHHAEKMESDRLLHAKLDHVITSSKGIPNFIDPKGTTND